MSGFNLNLSSYNPNKKKHKIKRNIETYSFFETNKFSKGISKNIEKIKRDIRFITIIIPPKRGTFDLCFLRFLSGLSKILIILESFLKLISINKLFNINIENILIILKIICYENIIINLS